jgi:hypothetical protein
VAYVCGTEGNHKKIYVHLLKRQIAEITSKQTSKAVHVMLSVFLGEQALSKLKLFMVQCCYK